MGQKERRQDPGQERTAFRRPKLLQGALLYEALADECARQAVQKVILRGEESEVQGAASGALAPKVPRPGGHQAKHIEEAKEDGAKQQPG